MRRLHTITGDGVTGLLEMTARAERKSCVHAPCLRVLSCDWLTGLYCLCVRSCDWLTGLYLIWDMLLW